jgi:uroporphyrinogen-III decarboxylase
MISFAPVVYEHAARFIRRTPWEVSRNRGLIVKAHIAAWNEYHHSPVTPCIDIYNLEAEAYGAAVAAPEGDEVPSITTPPLSEVKEILSLPLLDPEREGRIAMLVSAAGEIKEQLGDVPVRVPISGPFSIASNLCGFSNLLMALFDDPGLVRGALEHLSRGQLAFSRYVADQGLGTTLFESAATPPMLSPDTFRDVELPALQLLMQGIRELTGDAPALIMGGDTAPIAGYLLQLNPGFLICPGPGETDQAAFLERVRDAEELLVRVNMDIATLVSGDDGALEAECRRAVEIAGQRKKVLIGTGVLPFDADPERIHRIQEILNSLS